MTARRIFFIALIAAPSCRADRGDEQSALPPVAAHVEAPQDTSVIHVALRVPTVRPEVRGLPELAGLYTALMESGLADLADVVPFVRGSTISPGLAKSLGRGEAAWTATLRIEARGGPLFELSLDLCDAQQRCVDHGVVAEKDDPSAAVSALLVDTALQLGKKAFTGTSTAWSQPESHDPYAVLLAGRAAATWYGILPPPSPEHSGDKRRDPIERAILVDPTMPIGQWLGGRRALVLGRAKSAHLAFERAAKLRPPKQLYRADAAAALSAAGESDAALDAWEQVAKRTPSDLRFIIPHARALFTAGDAQRALRELEALPDEWDRDRSVVELRVAIDDAAGGTAESEQLLALWQEVAANEAEPVRRRISARIRRQDYAGALTLVPLLGERGASAEASRLGVALGIALHDYELAARELRALGMDEVLRRLRARAALEKDPAAAVPELASATDPVALVTVGGVYLARGRLDEALTEAERALKVEPWMPEALALRHEALLRLGRADDARQALVALHAADPAWGMETPVGAARTATITSPQGPTTAPGKTGLGVHEQSAVP